MINGDHLREAQTRLDELTSLSGYEPGSEEWLEAIGLELGPAIDAGELQAFAVQCSHRSGPEAYAREWIRKATLSGAVVVLLARQYAEREGAATT